MYEIEDGEKKERLGELDEGLGGLAGDYDRDGDERERGHVNVGANGIGAIVTRGHRARCTPLTLVAVRAQQGKGRHAGGGHWVWW